jgi:hypothetical protein
MGFLLLAVGIFTALRLVGVMSPARSPSPPSKPDGRPRSLLRKRFEEGWWYVSGCMQALTLLAPWTDAGRRKDRGVEVTIYTLLFGLVLICLANSNPTLREMWDAIR